MSEAMSKLRESHEAAIVSNSIHAGFDNPVLGSQSVFRHSPVLTLAAMPFVC